MNALRGAIRSRVSPLLKGEFGRGVVLIAGGAAAGQAIIALSSPLLTRLYSVHEIGVFAIYASLLGTLASAASLRYEVAVPLPERDEDGINVLALTMLTALAVAAIVLLGVALAGGAVARAVGAPDLVRYLWLLPAGLAAAGIYQALANWGVRKAAFGVIGRARVVQAGAQASAQVGLGLAGVGGGGMVGGDVLGRSVGALVYGGLLFGRDRAALRQLSFANVRVQARRYRRFPLLGTWSALANAAGLHLAPFMIALTYGTKPAGWFAVGQRVMALPTTIVGLAVSQVFLHHAAVAARGDRQSLRPLFLRAAKRLALIGCLIIVPAAIVAPWAFSFVFGSSWRVAGEYMQLAGIMFLSQFIVVPLSQTLNILERQDLQLAWDIGRLVAMLAAFGVARALSLPAAGAVAVFACTAAVSYAFLAVVSYRTIDRAGRELPVT